MARNGEDKVRGMMSIEQCRGSSKNWEERMVEANAAPKKVGRRGGTDKRIAKKN